MGAGDDVGGMGWGGAWAGVPAVEWNNVGSPKAFSSRPFAPKL